MIQNIYMIRDIPADTFLAPPWISNNDVGPVREFQRVLDNQELIFRKHPRDFHLLAIGQIDTTTGRLIDQENRTVAKAIDLIDQGDHNP